MIDDCTKTSMRENENKKFTIMLTLTLIDILSEFISTSSWFAERFSRYLPTTMSNSAPHDVPGVPFLQF